MEETQEKEEKKEDSISCERMNTSNNNYVRDVVLKVLHLRCFNPF